MDYFHLGFGMFANTFFFLENMTLPVKQKNTFGEKLFMILSTNWKLTKRY